MRPGRVQAGGFTLIELLVTLFIIGILAGVVVFRLGDRDQDQAVTTEAQRLRQLMGMARNEALGQGREWGLRLTADGYGFLRLDQDSNHWQAVDDAPFEARTLPDGIALRLSVEGHDRVGASDAGALLGRDRGPRPALLFLSSGEMTPFTLTVAAGPETQARRLQSDGFGDVTLDDGNAPPAPRTGDGQPLGAGS